MNSVLKLIEKIRQKPGLYIGRSSIYNLMAFLSGWYYRNPDTIEDIYILNEFQDWVEKRFKIGTPHSWAHIIAFHSQNEFEGLNNFFKLFDQFNEEKTNTQDNPVGDGVPKFST